MDDSGDQKSKIDKINLDLYLETEKQKDRITTLESRVATLQAELDSSKDSNQQIDQLVREKLALKTENSQLLETVNQLKQENSDLESRIEELEVELQNDTRTIDEDTFDKSEIDEKDELIEEQKNTIEKLEDELIELDRKYDTVNLRLKKKIQSLESDIEKLEAKNTKLSQTKFSTLRPQQMSHSPQISATDSVLLEKMKEILKSWPGGIKLRNLAMSMGISVSKINDFLEILQEENFVRIDMENVKNSNPVIFPL